MRYDVFRRKIGRELEINPRDCLVEHAIRRAYSRVRDFGEDRQEEQIETFVDAYRAARTLANSGFVRNFHNMLGRPSKTG